MSSNPISVLYIGGYSRSGSTLLLRLLGQLEGHFPIGELWDLWERSFTQNQLCGCGQPFRSCDFWRAVIDDAFGGMEQVDAAHMQALRHSVEGGTAVLPLVVPALRSPGYNARLAEYRQVLGSLYRAIRNVSGCEVIIDSSKVSPYAFLLHELPGLCLQLIHLVRDSRATAYSWQRKKRRPEIHWRTAYMARYSPLRSATEWVAMNSLLHLLGSRGVPYVRVRYEELVSQPSTTLQRAAQVLEVDWDTIALEGQDTFRAGKEHTVSGNPNRFQQGNVRIRPDLEWKQKMLLPQKGVVIALSWPLLLHYGYLGKRGDSESPDPQREEAIRRTRPGTMGHASPTTAEGGVQEGIPTTLGKPQ